MHDLVIRDGTIVDGTGAPRFSGDVAIAGGRIVQVGGTAGPGRREIAAAGRLVAPGWVDIHTHYDGQVTWDPYLSPSGWHGVTTVVMGNCGVGFAPAAPERHEWLIGLMEGVEDIPGTALAEGMRWNWESFPEYLDAIEAGPLALDVGTQVPHGAVRAYVMGARGAANEEPEEADLAGMAAIVEEALRAGALGFTTSRTMLHRAKDGTPVPGTFAGEAELLALGRAMGRAGHGVFEMASDFGLGNRTGAFADDISWMRKLAGETGLPVTYALAQIHGRDDEWRELLAQTRAAAEAGAPIKAQVAARPTGLLLGLECTLHPFLKHPSYKAIAHLPLAERVRRMRDPDLRARILGEQTGFKDDFRRNLANDFHYMFPLGDPPDYEPPAEASLAAMARARGIDPAGLVYDTLLERDGRELIYRPLANYADFDFEATREMLTHPDALLSLSDGGAHCGVICDASMPTFLLTHWARDRRRGPTLPLELAVRLQTGDTARAYGLLDRGVLAPGMKADLNVIDWEGLALRPPEIVYDLPAGGRRMIQRAAGYGATVVSGVPTHENGEPTGDLPGRLIRGPQPAPAA